ncbi:hypothetical protein K1X76_04920 [bacterium]|nr:hypothetical protein [bacterium]
MTTREIYRIDPAQSAAIIGLLDTVRSNTNGKEAVACALEGQRASSVLPHESGTYLIKINHNDCLSTLARKFGLGDIYGRELYRQNQHNNFVKNADLIIEGGYLLWTVPEEENNGIITQDANEAVSQDAVGTNNSVPNTPEGREGYPRFEGEIVRNNKREKAGQESVQEQKETQKEKEAEVTPPWIQPEIVYLPPVVRLEDYAVPHYDVASPDVDRTVSAFAPMPFYGAAVNEFAHGARFKNNVVYDVLMPRATEVLRQTTTGVSNRWFGGLESRTTRTLAGDVLTESLETKLGTSLSGGVIGEIGTTEGRALVQGGFFAPYTAVDGTLVKAGVKVGADFSTRIRTPLVEFSLKGEESAVNGTGRAIKFMMELPHFYEVRNLARNVSIDAAVDYLKSTGAYSLADDELLRKVAMLAERSAFAAALADVATYYGIKSLAGKAGASEKQAHVSGMTASVVAGNTLQLADPRALQTLRAVGKAPFYFAGFLTSDALIDGIVEYHANMTENFPRAIAEPIDWTVDTLLGTAPVAEEGEQEWFRRMLAKGLLGIGIGSKYAQWGGQLLRGAYNLLPAGGQQLVQSTYPAWEAIDGVLARGVGFVRPVFDNVVTRTIGSGFEYVYGAGRGAIGALGTSVRTFIASEGMAGATATTTTTAAATGTTTTAAGTGVVAAEGTAAATGGFSLAGALAYVPPVAAGVTIASPWIYDYFYNPKKVEMKAGLALDSYGRDMAAFSGINAEDYESRILRGRALLGSMPLVSESTLDGVVNKGHFWKNMIDMLIGDLSLIDDPDQREAYYQNICETFVWTENMPAHLAYFEAAYKAVFEMGVYQEEPVLVVSDYEEAPVCEMDEEPVCEDEPVAQVSVNPPESPVYPMEDEYLQSFDYDEEYATCSTIEDDYLASNADYSTASAY